MSTARPAGRLAPQCAQNVCAAGLGGEAHSVTVVLMDDLNTPLLDQGFARRQIARLLDTVKPSDRMALYALGPGLRVLHDFTDDGAALR